MPEYKIWLIPTNLFFFVEIPKLIVWLKPTHLYFYRNFLVQKSTLFLEIEVQINLLRTQFAVSVNTNICLMKDMTLL